MTMTMIASENHLTTHFLSPTVQSENDNTNSTTNNVITGESLDFSLAIIFVLGMYAIKDVQSNYGILKSLGIFFYIWLCHQIHI